MPCTDPKQAWVYGLTDKGKRKLVFKRPEYTDPDKIEKIKVGCGKCISCKIDHSREWATRITHEAQMWDMKCFITLTYNDENLPIDKSLSKKELRRFVKTLKQKLRRKHQTKIKYFACGEYGKKQNTFRPHYHLIIFGWDFPDKTWYRKTKVGSDLYRSNELEKIWKKGFSSIGEVTTESAAYVARYTLKKTSANPYDYLDKETGVILEKEFQIQTPGLGSDWYKYYKSDTYKDYLNIRGKKVRVPRYYDKKLEELEPERFAEIKEKRITAAIETQEDNTKGRRKQKDEVKKSQATMLIRQLSYED